MVETRRKTHRPKQEPAKALASQILAAAAKTKPNPAAFARAAKYAENAKTSNRFGRPKQTPEGLPIHRFRTEGETLTGVLGRCNGQMGYGESTYPIVLDDGSIVCVPGYRRLVKAFGIAKAFHQRITVTFIGKIWGNRGHNEYVFTVELAPLKSEGTTQAGRNLVAKAFADAKAKKEVTL